jgi:hypothetical protein
MLLTPPLEAAGYPPDRRYAGGVLKNDLGPIRFQRAFFNSTRIALRDLLFSRFSI